MKIVEKSSKTTFQTKRSPNFRHLCSFWRTVPVVTILALAFFAVAGTFATGGGMSASGNSAKIALITKGEASTISGASTASTLVDASTDDGWTEIDGNDTLGVGRVWTNFSVFNADVELGTGETGETVGLQNSGNSAEAIETGAVTGDDSDFLVELSALSSSLDMITEGGYEYNDIVLVLDESGSMSTAMSSTDSSVRMTVLKDTVREFLTQVKGVNQEISANSEGSAELNKVAIVTYSSTATVKSGLTSDISALDSVVGGLSGFGTTMPEAGLKEAIGVLSGDDARENAGKVIVFFTDGYPGSYNYKVEKDKAVPAINVAKILKENYGATFYSVGIFGGADATFLPNSDSAEETDLANLFMQAVSSNFPNASATTYENSGWQVELGAGSIDRGFYKTANTAEGLSEIFKEISAGIFGGTGSPLGTGGVVFSHQLGDYMEFDEWKLAYYGSGISDTSWSYTEKIENGDGSTTYSYSFQDGVSDTADGEIVLKVTKFTDLKTGDVVRVEIPASLVPTVTYSARMSNSDEISLAIKTTEPIRIFYGVSVKNRALEYLASGAVVRYDMDLGKDDNGSDAELAELVEFCIKSTENYGDVRFFASQYADGKSGTSATFIPAESNPFYYFTEDTELFYQDANGTLQKLSELANSIDELAQIVDESQSSFYYYENGYKLVDSGTGAVSAPKEVTATELKMWLQSEAVSVGSDNFYISAGTRKFIGETVAKTENRTGTSAKITDTTWVDGVMVEFGNNGYAIVTLSEGNGQEEGSNCLDGENTTVEGCDGESDGEGNGAPSGDDESEEGLNGEGNEPDSDDGNGEKEPDNGDDGSGGDDKGQDGKDGDNNDDPDDAGVENPGNSDGRANEQSTTVGNKTNSGVVTPDTGGAEILAPGALGNLPVLAMLMVAVGVVALHFRHR